MTYTAFLETIDPLQAELIIYIDKLILDLAGTTRKLRFRVPFYDYNSWFCYLNPVKDRQIDLCFLKGKAMAKTFPALDLRQRKMVSSLLIDVNSDIPNNLLIGMINHAICLNK